MPHSLLQFTAPVRQWFEHTLGAPSPVQEHGWGPIGEGRSTLLLAPTGSGKTLAAFLSGLNRLMFGTAPATPGVRLLYISPLKALGVDVERNLKTPIAGISATAERIGHSFRVPSIAIRSGDTPAAERVRFRKRPAEILITTPESLYLMLTSGAAETLRDVQTVILDEVHALIGTKRGAHLALSLERLELLRARAGNESFLQRIGLSATVRPVAEAALWVGGGLAGDGLAGDGGLVGSGGSMVPRAVSVVDASGPPRLKLLVAMPVEEMAKTEPVRKKGDLNGRERSIWPALHGALVELIRSHRSTLLFVNSRRLAERLSAALNDVAGEPLVLAHHGSLARERRSAIEEALKQGHLRALVATSSLELGIDMGSIDLVVQIEAPPSVATGLQRAGRAGHAVGGVSETVIFPKFRGDLLAAAATAGRMRQGLVEELAFPRNPLDVLAQQIVAIVSDAVISEDALYALVRQAAPFRDLPRDAFESVLDLLSGRYPSDEFAELKPRLVWDRLGHQLTARQGARRVAVVNGGTIPDRGLYGVFLSGSGEGKSIRVGELDEEMVFESRIGDVFLLGASSWRIEEITFDRVLVSPASGEPGKMPFWHGDRPGRPLELGRAIGRLCRELGDETEPAAAARLSALGLSTEAAAQLISYLKDQREATGTVCSDEQIVIEQFRDEVGDYRVCLLSPFGARVHAPWALSAMELARQSLGIDVEAVWSDDGIVFRLPEGSAAERLDLFLPKPGELDELLTKSLATSSLFAARFRENAARALLLPRKRPGQRTPLWAQRRRAADLLRAAAKYPHFPILLETYRECLRDVFDVPGLRELLGQIERRELRVARVETATASPFAASLLFSYVGNFIYEGDAPLAERRAHALIVDPAKLAALLGEAELRALLDPDAIVEVEADVQRAQWPLGHADAVHDLLIAIGASSEETLRTRVTDALALKTWLADLVEKRRIISVNIAGEWRFAAAEDAGRLRDALGVQIPTGLPGAFLESVEDAALDLVARFARTHGPFSIAALTRHLGIGEDPAYSALEGLELAGRVVRGAFLAGGTGLEWCDSEVLRRIKQKSLVKLRREVEPVEPVAYARLLIEWQGASKPRRGHDALAGVLEQLEGAPLVASALESLVLPARVESYRSGELDGLTGSGEWVWRGIEAIGSNDGRLAFYRSDRYALLAPAATAVEGELPERIREHLRSHGASFFSELVARTRAFPRDVLEALWQMLWAGELTNDTLAPLRARMSESRLKDRPQRSRQARPRSPAIAGSEGRWWLTQRLLPTVAPSGAERATARVEVLLERYGVLPREAIAADGLGTFSDLYPVLKALEDAGRIRRGYFVSGLGAAQFAQPGADDRLRRLRTPDDSRSLPVVLAATDPANPYGAALPWPDGEPRPQRAASALVVIDHGALLGYLGRREKTLRTFLPEDPAQRADLARRLALALASLVDGVQRRALIIATVDGAPARPSKLGEALEEAGFTPVGEGYLLRAARPAGRGAREAR